MKLAAALFVFGAGALLALGQMTATQWHAIGLALLALTLRYGLTVLPWLLVVLLGWLCRRFYRTAVFWRGAADRYLDTVLELKGTVDDLRLAQRRPAQRKRATR